MAITVAKTGKGGGIRLPGQPDEPAAALPSALPSILTEDDEELARRIARESAEAEEVLAGNDALSKEVERSDRERSSSAKRQREQRYKRDKGGDAEMSNTKQEEGGESQEERMETRVGDLEADAKHDYKRLKALEAELEVTKTTLKLVAEQAGDKQQLEELMQLAYLQGHTINTLVTALEREQTAKDDTTIVIVRKRGTTMRQLFDLKGKLQTKIEASAMHKHIAVGPLGAGPTLRVEVKSSNQTKPVRDAISNMTDELGQGHAFAIFQGKTAMGQLREKPLVEARKALLEHYQACDPGKVAAKGSGKGAIIDGLRPFWPDLSGSWVLTVKNVPTIWSHTRKDQFKIQIYVDEKTKDSNRLVSRIEEKLRDQALYIAEIIVSANVQEAKGRKYNG